MKQKRYFSRWKPRFFRLENGHLNYFDKKTVTNSRKNKVRVQFQNGTWLPLIWTRHRVHFFFVPRYDYTLIVLNLCRVSSVPYLKVRFFLSVVYSTKPNDARPPSLSCTGHGAHDEVDNIIHQHQELFLRTQWRCKNTMPLRGYDSLFVLRLWTLQLL